MDNMILKEIFWMLNGYMPIASDGRWLYRKKPGHSLKKAAKLFNKIEGENIIEIGSGLQGEMSGDSMLVWTKLTNAKTIIAIDMDKEQLATLDSLKQKYPQIQTMKADGIEFIKTYDKKISLLYLDFWSPDNKNELLGTNRANDYLAAYINARNKFEKKAIILIDDTDHIEPWKQSLIIPEARKDGFIVKWSGRQTLLLKEE